MTAAETVRVAVVDAINQQHPILGRNDPRPQGAPFVQWVEQGHQLGLSAVLDVDALAQFVADQLANCGAVQPDHVGDLADFRWSDGTRLRVMGARANWQHPEGLDAPLPADEELDDPFPSPTDPEPASDRPGVICQHCGQTIVPAAGIGGGWRHVASGFLNCGPTHETPAEP